MIQSIPNSSYDKRVSLIPIIAKITHAIQGSRERVLEIGMNDYMSKPIIENELIEIIRQYIKKITPKFEIKKIKSQKSKKSEIFNREDFLNRIRRDYELFYECLQVTLDQLPVQIEELKKNIEDKNAHQIKLKAHSIKGLGLHIAANKLSDAAYQLEKAGKEGILEKTFDLMEKLDQEYMILMEVLNNEISNKKING